MGPEPRAAGSEGPTETEAMMTVHLASETFLQDEIAEEDTTVELEAVETDPTTMMKKMVLTTMA